MFKSYWYIAVAFGLIAVAVLLTGSQQIYDQPTPYCTPQQEQGHSANGANQISSPDCIVKPKEDYTPAKKREWYRDEYDLKAQRQMANWAYGMMIISGIGVLVAFAGLIFIIRTFTTARDMNDITRKAFKTDLRPWVSIDNITITTRQIDNHNNGTFSYHFDIAAELHNTGKTPAIHLGMDLRWTARNISVEGPVGKGSAKSQRELRRYMLAMAESKSGQVIMPDGIRNMPHALADGPVRLTDQLMVNCHIGVVYKARANEPPMYITENFTIANVTTGNGMGSFSIQQMAAEEVEPSIYRDGAEIGKIDPKKGYDPSHSAFLQE